MSVHKDKKTGKWLVSCRYDNWDGARKQKMKRGFETKREAQAWEREFLQIKGSNLDMTFGSFVELYYKDRQARLKKNTFLTKAHIIENKILPYFKDKKLCDIKATDIIAWQNVIMAERDERGEPHAPSYLKTIHNQISAIFNHACNFYNLSENPARKAGNMGKEKTKEMVIWTKEEYLKFADQVKDKPQAFYAFEILYWCGLRVGELLALTPSDFDFEKSTLRINKSYQRLEGEDIITDPKTPCSVRTIAMPDFLNKEIQEYIKMIYGIGENDRIFDFTKSFLHHEMKRGSAAAGVKKLSLHQLRHSHVSLLISMGFTAVAIAKRVGHESIDITYRYAHMFPSEQTEMADKLNIERG
jgi:integrase